MRFLIKTLLLGGILMLANQAGSAQGELTDPVVFYDAKGVELTQLEAVEMLQNADVICFGELHNHAVDHWLQLQWTKHWDKSRDIVLGAEMFEWDNQVLLDEFLSGMISESQFIKDARTWPNYETDYKPLLDYAKENELAFVATNVPRRYASLTAKSGQEALQTLPESSKVFLPSLPFEVNENDTGYAMMEAMMGSHGHGMNVALFVEAQALKDVAMATAIKKNLNEGQLFVHYNGSFHSQYHAGIVGYLQKIDPSLEVMVIASQEAELLNWNEEWSGSGDVIIVCPSTMTKTH